MIKMGTIYGNIDGGEVFNDAKDGPLTYNDRITSVSAGWTADVLDFVTFTYSSGKSEQHGAAGNRESPFNSEFDLDHGENINGVSVYTGIRMINNPFSPNGSALVVGLRFYTDKGRSSVLLGSSNGTAANESLPSYTLAYVRGSALGYLDSVQFIWYTSVSPSATAALLTY